MNQKGLVLPNWVVEYEYEYEYEEERESRGSRVRKSCDWLCLFNGWAIERRFGIGFLATWC